jgi:hypothetical protein
MSPRNFFTELKRRYSGSTRCSIRSETGGLTIEEAAKFLKLSHGTLEREWTAAKAWLYRELSQKET